MLPGIRFFPFQFQEKADQALHPDQALQNEQYCQESGGFRFVSRLL